jgi:hypothetical protein
VRRFEWRKNVALDGILDAKSSLLTPKVVDNLVGSQISQEIAVDALVEVESASGPQLFEVSFPFFRSVVKGQIRWPDVRQAGPGALALVEEDMIETFAGALFFL